LGGAGRQRCGGLAVHGTECKRPHGRVGRFGIRSRLRWHEAGRWGATRSAQILGRKSELGDLAHRKRPRGRGGRGVAPSVSPRRLSSPAAKPWGHGRAARRWFAPRLSAPPLGRSERRFPQPGERSGGVSGGKELCKHQRDGGRRRSLRRSDGLWNRQIVSLHERPETKSSRHGVGETEAAARLHRKKVEKNRGLRPHDQPDSRPWMRQGPGGGLHLFISRTSFRGFRGPLAVEKGRAPGRKKRRTSFPLWWVCSCRGSCTLVRAARSSPITEGKWRRQKAPARARRR